MGLVDQPGYLDDAVSKAGELGGITGKPRVIEHTHAPTLMEILTGVTSRAHALSLAGSIARPRRRATDRVSLHWPIIFQRS